MKSISQDAHEFRCKGGIEKLQHHFAVGRIAGGDGAVIDVLAGALAQGSDVGE